MLVYGASAWQNYVPSMLCVAKNKYRALSGWPSICRCCEDKSREFLLFNYYQQRTFCIVQFRGGTFRCTHRYLYLAFTISCSW